MKRPGLFIAIFLAVLLTLIAYSTLHGPIYRAQVCMSYQGRSACKTIRAKTEDGALRAGRENACADIASGVSDTMRCVESKPQSVKWMKRP